MNSTFSKKNYIAITAADRWLANAVARGLLYEKRKSEICIQALTQNPHDRHIKELEKYGADICKIDYKEPESLSRCLTDSHVIVFVAESNKNRINQARAMAKAAKAAKVGGAIILSVEGAGKSDLDTQRDYSEIEKIWRESNIDCVAVLRLSFIQQGFFLWSYGVQETGKWLWLPKEKEKFTPVSLYDIVNCIRSLVTYKDKFVPLDKKHHQKTYLLTGPDSLSGRDIVDINNNAIRGEGEVGFKKIDRRELENYLKRLGEDDDLDVGLARRTAAQFLHRGLAALHDSVSELIKGNESNLEDGVNTFNDGIDLLERAIDLSQDSQYENQQIRNMNRFENQRNRNTNRFENQRTRKNRFENDQFETQRIRNINRFENRNMNLRNRFEDDQSGNQRNYPRDLRTLLRQLRNYQIERIFNLSPEERTNYLDELRVTIDQVQSCATENIGSLCRPGEESIRHECYPAPFLPLEEIEIELVADVLEYINTGKAGKTTEDVKDITRREPEPVDSFFERNYKDFVPEDHRRLRQDDLDASNDQGRTRYSRL